MPSDNFYTHTFVVKTPRNTWAGQNNVKTHCYRGWYHLCRIKWKKLTFSIINFSLSLLSRLHLSVLWVKWVNCQTSKKGQIIESLFSLSVTKLFDVLTTRVFTIMSMYTKHGYSSSAKMNRMKWIEQSFWLCPKITEKWQQTRPEKPVFIFHSKHRKPQ